MQWKKVIFRHEKIGELLVRLFVTLVRKEKTLLENSILVVAVLRKMLVSCPQVSVECFLIADCLLRENRANLRVDLADGTIFLRTKKCA